MPSLPFVELPGGGVLERKVAYPGHARGRSRRFDLLGWCANTNDSCAASSGCRLWVKADVRGAETEGGNRLVAVGQISESKVGGRP